MVSIWDLVASGETPQGIVDVCEVNTYPGDSKIANYHYQSTGFSLILSKV
jgi:hypothetical protein